MSPARLLVLVLPLVSGLACSPHYVQVTAPVRALAEEGREDEALQTLDRSTETSNLDALLVEVDRGMVLHRAGRWETSAKALTAAARLADARETVTLGDEFFGRAPWRMGTLERQALHAINALNFLMLGDEDGAVVEARLTDSLHLQARVEEEVRRKLERNLALAPFDEEVRGYLERLAIGRYISGLAHQRAGNEDSAFIDYLDAWRITQSAPPGAPSTLLHLQPWLLAEARRLGRPEVPELERAFANVAETWTPPAAGEGEVVVFIEAGRIPERAIAGGQAAGQGYWAVRARDWTRAKAQVGIDTGGTDGALHTAETVTSLENLLLRRGHLGALTDTERAASLDVNLALFGGYLLLPPVGAVLLIKRAYEVNVRMAQGWLTLPAELQVVRLRAPVGETKVRVVLGGIERVVPVTVTAGAPAPVVVRIE